MVWPENSTAVDPFLDTTTNVLISSVSDELGVPLLVGAMVDADDDSLVLNQGVVWHPGRGGGDRYTKRHSEDVARYGEFLGRRLGLDEDMLRTVRVAGLLHDVGKIGIPDVVLRKAGRLTAEEFEVVKQHVALGDLIVRDLPDLEAVRAGVRHHHERWDGGGYPDGLADEAIPLFARIVAVADAFDAMTTHRPYNRVLSAAEAAERLRAGAGVYWDPQIIAVFLDWLRATSKV